MSNISRRFERRFPKIFPARYVSVRIFFLLAAATIFPIERTAAETEPLVDREKIEGVVDDSPLARSGDKAAWDHLFGVLARRSQDELESQPAEKTGFTELNRQPVEYRGRLVRITGKLLRCEFVPQRRADSPFGASEGAGSVGYYESWVLVRDQKRIPIAVCSLEIPEGMPVGDGLDEQVTVTGFFYKRQLFLDADDEEVTTPTILAKTLRWTPTVRKEQAEKSEKKPAWDGFFVTILTLIVLWGIFRYFGRRVDAGRRERIPFKLSSDLSKPKEEEFDGKIRIPGFAGKEEETDDDEEYATPIINGEDTTIITPKPGPPPEDSGAMMLLVFVLQSALLTGAVFGQEPKQATSPVDAEFTKTLLKMDELSWDALGDERVPLEQQREPVLDMLAGMIRSVPGSFLKNGVAHDIPAKDCDLSMLARDPARYRGKAFKLTGHVVHVEEVPLNPAEKRNCHIPRAFRCRIQTGQNGQTTDKHEAEILCGFVPTDWKRNEPIRERAGLIGIYIKRIPVEKNTVKNVAEAEPKLFEEGVPFVPLLVAARIEWFPDTFLGNLDFDMGSFEQVPPLKISDLKKKEFDVVSPSLELLGRNDLVRRAFKFTPADTAPFYGLLRATRLTPPGRIEQEARTEMEKGGKKRVSAVELFNHPARMRGKPVLLYGTAKRVMTTLVEDKEVKELYGIDRYYQIYLYTDDSQGNPIVVCTTSLPDGMPSGTAPDYAERISIGAIPYKLWVYETEAKLEDADGHKPSFAPLLVGRCPKWYPDEKQQGPMAVDPNDPRTAFTFGIFAVLILVWLFFRRFKSTGKIEFKLKK